MSYFRMILGLVVLFTLGGCSERPVLERDATVTTKSVMEFNDGVSTRFGHNYRVTTTLSFEDKKKKTGKVESLELKIGAHLEEIATLREKIDELETAGGHEEEIRQKRGMVAILLARVEMLRDELRMLKD